MSHAEFLRAEGGGDGVAAAIREGRWTEADLTERQRALCAVAHKLSSDPHDVGPSDWDALRAIGLDDEGCLEVAHVVGIFNHLTRLADGFGISLDPHTLVAASGGRPLKRPT